MIKLEHLSKSYSQIRAVDDLSLNIRKGEIFGLLGPNGAGKTEQAANGISWAVMIFLAMIGGGMLPVFLMPPRMKTFSQFSPIKWTILALEGAIWRQFSFAEMRFPVFLLIGIGLVTFGIGVKAYRWRQTE